MAKTAKTVKKVTKRVAKAVKLPDILYVVSERKFFTVKPIIAFADRESAYAQARTLDEKSGVSFNKYTVARVVTGV